MEKELVVIGKGPAGVSAAIYGARSGVDTLVLAKDGGALLKAERIENYYGLPTPVSGTELLRVGERQLASFGIPLLETEVTDLSLAPEGGFLISDKKETIHARAVILATGANRSTLSLPGLKELNGHGVSSCAVCDGFFFRGKDVAVLGNGEYALHEAGVLLPVCKSVTLLTDGKPLPKQLPSGMKTDGRRLGALTGKDKLETVTFQTGAPLPVAGLFLALGVAGSAALAKKIGVPMENNRPVIDSHCETGLPGLFSAGDCNGGMLQVAKAVYEGALAGSQAAKEIIAGRHQAARES